MKGLSVEKLSKLEKEVVAEIRAMKASTDNVQAKFLLENPAQLVHHFILASHGNVQLRMIVIARELGVGMRTLERAFVSAYQLSMARRQAEARLSFSKWMLSIFPPTKITVVAALLGYGRVQDFNRFFKKHTRQSPSAWGIEERERIVRTSKEAPK